MKPDIAESIAREFNNQWPMGVPCWLVDDNGDRHQTSTRSRAWAIGGEDEAEPVILIHGLTGACVLNRLVIINTGFADPALPA